MVCLLNHLEEQHGRDHSTEISAGTSDGDNKAKTDLTAASSNGRENMKDHVSHVRLANLEEHGALFSGVGAARWAKLFAKEQDFVAEIAGEARFEEDEPCHAVFIIRLDFAD